MHRFLKRIRKGLRGAAGALLHGYPFRFDYTKKELIDVAFTRLPRRPTSFADLGGVWGIDGAYTFYILQHYPIHRAVLVDTDFTDRVRANKERFDALVLVEGDFGDRRTVERIGQIDAVLLFDVLLHQVKPDWDEVLEIYAPRTQCFMIYNQQFIAGEKTIRLPELGKEQYFKHVPMDPNSPGYRNLFERPDEIHPRYNKRYGDVHNVWQWGITDDDLVAVLERLGFRVAFRENHGQFSNSPAFENHAFLFTRA